ncbi:MAG: hypothetical protein E7273_06270 [Pseudobutyrivibrio ruminis]|nr:hypothetical protein [Pseudobutyrivibrio ruminis]
MKRVLVSITMAALIAATTIGCGATDKSSTAVEEVQENEMETTTEENTEVTGPEEIAEESSEFVLEDGVITHLCEVASNPDATTNMDEGVSYMFNKDDEGNRILGSVMAYYSGLSYDGVTDNESFCKAFIDDYTPEISEKWDTAEIHDESNMYGAVISLEECDVTLMPDNDLEGMTVFVSTK